MRMENGDCSYLITTVERVRNSSDLWRLRIGLECTSTLQNNVLLLVWRGVGFGGGVLLGSLGLEKT